MPRERSMSRRDFLRQGALLTTALAAGLPEALSLLHPRAAEGAIMGIGQELRDVLNEETVNRILQEALARGGDAADLFAEQRFRTSIVLDSGKIDSVTYGYPRGGGVRVVLRNQTGYAFSDELTYNSLLDAARVASSVVETQSRANPIDVTRRTLLPPFTLVNPEPLMPEAGKLDILRRMDAAARAADPRIVSVRIEYMDDVRDVLIMEAGPAPAGPMPVVVAPGWGGVLIHESLGHALEADGIRRGTSLLAGLQGTRVASPLVRVVDDARWPNGRGSYAMDDEGAPGQRTVAVEGGILQSYLVDKQNGRLLTQKSTGNGRRMSYRNWPIPRMTNTYIDKGTSDPASLLNGITKGLYAAELGGGSVETTSGNFNFAVREGYWIENGKLTRPVRGAVLVGNSLETMQRIEGIGNDLKVETTRGTCGKDGQQVPVGVGQPTVRFSSITVGGPSI
ncbi:MAG: TldD/PmbA family protein [Candidatus Eisenbacteria bacterium]|uniref:TldD/PmbA family protein n=1 Tax=Eiseniibacteriota bacterium TaxID=2212470 RepID=A0A538SAC4_UNCEI|nr:MAG: TldD/PmbA family protein [Candidatus Eisenbacteria bacterium]